LGRGKNTRNLRTASVPGEGEDVWSGAQKCEKKLFGRARVLKKEEREKKG